MKVEVFDEKQLNKRNIAELLALEDFSPIYKAADDVRRQHVGDTVHLRAIIEFSNICKRQCIYCGLNCGNKDLPRFRMSREEIVETARQAVEAGYRTIVLQSGEDDYFTARRLGEIISDIKKLRVSDPNDCSGRAPDGIKRFPVRAPGGGEHFPTRAPYDSEHFPAIAPAVTISCGERSRQDLKYWRDMGADRYLLKHETADPVLYDRLHPCGTLEQRIDCLKTIHALGYETGSGFMVGLPGQTTETLAMDLLLLKSIPCKMAGIGPFISNPKTPLAGERNGEPELVRRAVAIARLLLPEANLPLTTALSVLSEQGKNCRATVKEGGDTPSVENPFSFGANVIMKKVTPDGYKKAYEIYPAEFAETDIRGDRQMLERLIRGYGRVPL